MKPCHDSYLRLIRRLRTERDGADGILHEDGSVRSAAETRVGSQGEIGQPCWNVLAFFEEEIVVHGSSNSRFETRRLLVS